MYMPPSPPSTMKLRAFETWIRDNGGKIKNVQLEQFDGMGTGVQATSKIQEKDEVLYIPRSIIICRDTVEKLLPRKFLQAGPHSDDDILIAFLIIEQRKGSASKWAPYLNVLPETIPTSLAFTNAEVTELQDEELADMVYSAQATARVAFDALAMKLSVVLKKQNAVLTMEQFIWAKAVLNSRALTIRGQRFLVPFADMFNGHAHPDIRASNNGARFLDFHVLSNDAVRIYADRSCDSGAQLFEDYGDSDNYVFAFHHGFLMAENPFDCVRLPLPKPTQAQAQLLRSLGVLPQPHVCMQPNGETVNSLAQVEVNSLSQLELEACRGSASCIDVRDKSKLQRYLSSLAASRLEAFPTSVDDDVAILLANTTTPAMRLIVDFRLSRKMLLQQLLETLSTPTPSTTSVTTSTTPQYSTEEKLDRFHRWIDAAGCTPNKLKVAYIGNGYGFGAFATDTIAPDEVYLGVPTSIVMDSASARRCPILGPLYVSLQASTGNRDAFHELLLHLMYEKFVRGETSFWAPYLALLPQPEAEIDVPLFFSPNQVDALAPALDFHDAVLTYRDNVAKSFAAIDRIVFSKQSSIFPRDIFTRANYRWARYILDTRSIWWLGERRLVPLLDMVNCNENPVDPMRVHATTLSSDGKSAITKASWEFPRAAQVFENYGQPNWIYMLYHGFVLPKNSHDCVHLVMYMDPAIVQANDSFQSRVRAVGSFKPEFCLKETTLTKAVMQAAAVYVDVMAMTDPSYKVNLGGDKSWQAIAALRLVLTKRQASLESISGLHDNSMIRMYMEQQHQMLGRLVQALDQKLDEPLM
ncbi:hypothetical protein AC1031_016409 [Aphanomyces cochlioides]|nr:hypothetical protein AC1031_016409 [Aphanomyces cochlioides]